MVVDVIDLEKAVNEFSNKEYGIHYLVIYPDLMTLREFYSYYIQKSLEEKKEVVQIAPFYETEDSVRCTLSEGNRAIKDIEKLENEKSLIIVDSYKKYLQYKDVKSDYDSNKRLVKFAKSIGKNGVSVLGDIGAFPFENMVEELVGYELFLPIEYENMEFKGICLYHKADFIILTKEQRQKLAIHHGRTIEIKPYC